MKNYPPFKFLKPGDKMRLFAGGTDVGDINIENVNSVVCYLNKDGGGCQHK